MVEVERGQLSRPLNRLGPRSRLNRTEPTEPTPKKKEFETDKLVQQLETASLAEQTTNTRNPPCTHPLAKIRHALSDLMLCIIPEVRNFPCWKREWVSVKN